MKGLSSLERIVLEAIGKKTLTYNEILEQTGLHANVCFNIIQALIIRSLLKTDGFNYSISENISPLMMEELNGQEAKEAESLEMIEAVVSQSGQKTFRFKKVAMDERDEKIFLAMLSNLESFLNDAHKKSKEDVLLKDRKVIFWGVGEVQSLMNQIIEGK